MIDPDFNQEILSFQFTENGSLTWNNRKPVKYPPRKLTCPLKRDYLSIGNTSSNHRFSGGHVSFPGSNQSQNSSICFTANVYSLSYPFICPKNLVFPLYSNDRSVDGILRQNQSYKFSRGGLDS